MLAIGPDAHGGRGVFAHEAIPAGAVVTHYHGPVRYPRFDRHVSETHSLHILPELGVPVEKAEYRVIDGSWAQQAAAAHQGGVAAHQGAAATTPLPASLASRVGSMINSCWRDRRLQNVATDSRSFDNPLFEYKPSTVESVREHLTAEQLEGVWGDPRRPWLSLAMVATRDIPAGEELLWPYPFKPSAA